MERDRIKLVVFDVEGVLIPKARFLFFDVFGRMGVVSFTKAALYGLLYLLGLISLKNASERIYGLLKGVSYDMYISLFDDIPLMPGVEKVFLKLKRDGVKTVLISSGIPEEGLERLAGRLGADYVEGVEVGVSGGRLSGEIGGDVLESEGKAIALRKILRKDKLESKNCAVVADDRNNLSLFQLCDLRIGYNPDFVLSRRADHVVDGELVDVIPFIEGGSARNGGRGLPRNVILREAIHTGGFSVAVLSMYFLSPVMVALLIFIVTVLYLASETARMFGRKMPLVSDITRMAAGGSEYQEFVTSPIFFAFGMIISLLLFPKPIGYVSIAVLALGDGFASIVGRTFGRRRLNFNKNKSVEGSLGFFLAALAGSILFIDPLRALIASIVGTLTEVLPLPVNDNLTIPLASGLVLTALALV